MIAQEAQGPKKPKPNPYEDAPVTDNPYEDAVPGSDPAFGWGQNFSNATPDATMPNFSNGFQGLKDALGSLGKGAVEGATLGAADPGPSPVPEGEELGKFLGASVPFGVAGKALGMGAEALGSNPLTQSLGKILAHGHGGGIAGAYYGYKEGGLPGAVAGYAGGGLLGKALAGAAGKGEAGVATASAGRPVDYNKLLTTGMNEAGYDASRVASGKTAMQTGIEALTPRAPAPMGMSDAFNAAGAAGRDASMGQAKMATGIENASVQPPMPSMGGGSKAAGSMGGYGVGKGSGMAAVGGALLAPQGSQQPGAPALSTDLPEAKNLVLEALGQPREQLYQMLSTRFDPATVKFAMAGLPNRLPQ